ncbi:MAG: response regulator [Acidobacteria bacterium]|nr:MAG: response regulator [Acidobacteriota bacterium]
MTIRKCSTRQSVEILLVEDNPGDTRLMQEAFKEGGFNGRLNITCDGEQAIAFLRHEGPHAESPRPAFILLDLNLPRKDGREVLAEIKTDEKLRQIPVVVLSTSTSAEDIRKAYDLHANCYIPKPVDLETFVELGRVIERFWLHTAVLG